MLALTRPPEQVAYVELRNSLLKDLAFERARVARVAGYRRTDAKRRREPDYWSVRNMFAAAIRAGAEREGLHSCVWDISGDCTDKKQVTRFARPAAPMVQGVWRGGVFVPSNEPGTPWSQSREVIIRSVVSGLTPRPPVDAGSGSVAVGPWSQRGLTSLWVTQIVRCGKCTWCLALRARKWQLRALQELSRASRTWWVTLTIKPEIHNWIKAQAAGLFEKAFVNRKPGDYDALQQDVRFAKCAAVGFEEVTRYLKRLRKAAKTVGVRYLLVAEPHEGKRRNKALPGQGENYGLPHFHMFIHETGEAKLTKRIIESRWRWGHTKVKLVQDGAAKGHSRYLCKYISKSQASRTRASLEYGTSSLVHSDLKDHVKTNDPTPFHCIKESDSERQEKNDETARIAADAAIGTAVAGQEDPNAIGREVAHVAHRQEGLQSQLQGLSVSMTRTFKRLAAKDRARSDPAVESAVSARHALIGHTAKPSGPFSVLEREGALRIAEGTLPGLVLEAEGASGEKPKDEREELMLRNAAAAVSRNAPAARRARVVADNARIALEYHTPVEHEPVPPPPPEPPKGRRLLWHGYPVSTQYLRPPARARSRR